VSHLPTPDPWAEAYLRFETPAEELRKFKGRLVRLGAGSWPRTSAVVELCCGRGNGLRALHELGFSRIAGIDISLPLLARYDGPGQVVGGDCRQLPFPDESKDVVIVQGGFHHLPRLPGDLDRSLAEAARVLRPEGRFVLVEPWLTPFLRFVHFACRQPAARRLSAKLDALATMIEHERETYEQWLGAPQLVRESLQRFFRTERLEPGWGKLVFVGRKGPSAA
jgi:ubiquinone/menaquinone biosynthesis C-methylase UbiE